jgi:arsenate reductase
MAARILFLCTHNACRSQFAEAYLKRYAGTRFEVFSAGVEPTELHPLTRRVLEEDGLDCGSLRSKGLEEVRAFAPFETVFVVCRSLEESCPKTIAGWGPRLAWPFEDPAAFAGQPEACLAKFRQIRDEVSQRIQTWLRMAARG